MRKITKYEEFISESKLQLLLEAKIKFSDEFITLLNKIESPIVKKMLDLDGEEVDINRNYMTYNIDKEDSVVFYPEDKAEKQDYRITSSGHCYYGLAELAEKNKSYPIEDIGRPEDNQKVKVIKELTKEDLEEISPSNSIGNPIVHISFNTEYGERQCFYSKNHLVRDISELKPSDTRVGRFVTNFLDKANVKFTHEELNDFIVKYKSEMKELKEKFKRFEVVTGKDIAYWYLESRYENAGSGSLGSSCMRHSRCQSYFDIYTQNDEVSLIILKSKNDPNKIIGRALLWSAELVNRPDETDDADIKFMDKIYVNDYSDENFFIKYARAHGFYYKRFQDSSSTPLMFDGKELTNYESLIKVSVGSSGYHRYPYIDTLCYYDEDDGYLSNDNESTYDYTLQETEGGNGSCSTCGGTGEVECRNCSGDGEESCDDCYNGTNDCRDCDGSGNIDCYNCEGAGTIECSNCDGDGQIDCAECDGTGEDGDEECSYCSGSGKENCSECDGEGKNDCNNCDGDGTTECENCDGDGDIECETCYGRGEHECYRCEGSGRHDCDDC